MASVLSQAWFPRHWVLLESAIYQPAPQFMLAAIWLGLLIWVVSQRRKDIPALVGVLAFLITAWPPIALAPSWVCVTGTCYW